MWQLSTYFMKSVFLISRSLTVFIVIIHCVFCVVINPATKLLFILHKQMTLQLKSMSLQKWTFCKRAATYCLMMLEITLALVGISLSLLLVSLQEVISINLCFSSASWLTWLSWCIWKYPLSVQFCSSGSSIYNLCWITEVLRAGSCVCVCTFFSFSEHFVLSCFLCVFQMLDQC